MSERRVVITGRGIVSSIGNNCDEVLDSLRNLKSGIVGVPEWAELKFKSCVAGTIKGLDLNKIRQDIGPKSRYLDFSALYSTLATMEALEESGLDPDELASVRVGCIVGPGFSNSEPILQAGSKLFHGEGRIGPYGVTRSMANSCSANLVNLYGIKGRSYSIASACATALHNIGHGMEVIKSGSCDLVLAGGAEEVSTIYTSLFDGMRSAISTSFNDDPERASRPYDRRRDGFVISGGGGIVILEDYERAKGRGANIYGEVLGYGASSDGHDIIQPHPEGDGALRCMNEALDMAGCSAGDLDYINTHGTSTPAGDIAEATALKRLLGDHGVPISSTKALTGHGIGACGVQELIYCLLMMEHGFMAASANIEELDPALPELNIITENRESDVKTVLTNSFGFGGTNACMLVGRL
jgi:3-oxoacyl-[acyl-carrier-protein] synthase-1